MDEVRWGILGTGNIAKQFARGLAILPDADLAAVGSRTLASADDFGDEFDVPRRHSSYAALADDPDVDVVYVATPHTLHCENSLLCLQAGKAVLCEKPFTVNAGEAEQIIALAREKGLFLMEAMWTRFLPAMAKTRQLLADGAIGDVRMLMADFGFRASFNPQSRLFDPSLGGGALLDVGVYPISLASLVFGAPPSRISSMAHLGQTGVDEQGAMIFGYDQGQLAVLIAATQANTPQAATVSGTGGRIQIYSPWWQATTLTLSVQDQAKVLHLPFKGNGYNYEAAEVMNCLRDGKTESDVLPLDETLSIMQTMDQIRAQWGLRYPME